MKDDQRVWQTSNGVHVLTQGHPWSDVAVPLVYQPDLLKGEVTGQITGVGVQLVPGSYSAAAIVRVDTGEHRRHRHEREPGLDAHPVPPGVRSREHRSDRRLRRRGQDRLGPHDLSDRDRRSGHHQGEPAHGRIGHGCAGDIGGDTAATSESGNRTLWPIILAIGLAIFAVSWFRSRKAARATATGIGAEGAPATPRASPTASGQPVQPTEGPPDQPTDGTPTSG